LTIEDLWYRFALSFLIKSTEYLNFRHFRHFATLDISLGNLIVSQKDLATSYNKIISKVLLFLIIVPLSQKTEKKCDADQRRHDNDIGDRFRV
jgi:hypothetical protein